MKHIKLLLLPAILLMLVGGLQMRNESARTAEAQITQAPTVTATPTKGKKGKKMASIGSVTQGSSTVFSFGTNFQNSLLTTPLQDCWWGPAGTSDSTAIANGGTYGGLTVSWTPFSNASPPGTVNVTVAASGAATVGDVQITIRASTWSPGDNKCKRETITVVASAPPSTAGVRWPKGDHGPTPTGPGIRWPRPEKLRP